MDLRTEPGLDLSGRGPGHLPFSSSPLTLQGHSGPRSSSGCRTPEGRDNVHGLKCWVEPSFIPLLAQLCLPPPHSGCSEHEQLPGPPSPPAPPVELWSLGTLAGTLPLDQSGTFCPGCQSCGSSTRDMETVSGFWDTSNIAPHVILWHQTRRRSIPTQPQWRGGVKDPPEYCSFGVHKRISRTEAQIYDNTVKLNQHWWDWVFFFFGETEIASVQMFSVCSCRIFQTEPIPV